MARRGIGIEKARRMKSFTDDQRRDFAICDPDLPVLCVVFEHRPQIAYVERPGCQQIPLRARERRHSKCQLSE